MQAFIDSSSAVAIALLAFVGALFLLRLARIKRDWSIFSAAMPRIYLAIAYGWIVLFSPSAEQRTVTIRIALLFWLLTEIAIHVVVRRNHANGH